MDHPVGAYPEVSMATMEVRIVGKLQHPTCYLPLGMFVLPKIHNIEMTAGRKVVQHAIRQGLVTFPPRSEGGQGTL